MWPCIGCWRNNKEFGMIQVEDSCKVSGTRWTWWKTHTGWSPEPLDVRHCSSEVCALYWRIVEAIVDNSFWTNIFWSIYKNEYIHSLLLHFGNIVQLLSFIYWWLQFSRPGMRQVGSPSCKSKWLMQSLERAFTVLYFPLLHQIKLTM